MQFLDIHSTKMSFEKKFFFIKSPYRARNDAAASSALYLTLTTHVRISIIILILQMRKVKLRETTWLMAALWENQFHEQD